MAQNIPKTTKQWVIVGENDFDSLNFIEADVPELAQNEVLVKCRFLHSAHFVRLSLVFH